MIQMGYRPQLRMPPPMLGQMPQMGALGAMGMMPGELGFDGKMLRKSMARKTVDYHPSVVKYLENRIWKKDNRDDRALQADQLYTQLLTLPQDMIDNPVSCVTSKFIRAALNKDPRPIFCVCWTPDGRRLITGASSGEFTLWNGLTFNFETILQAHNSAVRSMIWSRNEQWMLTGDDKGYVKYWQANMNNVKMFQGHFESIRGLSFSPNDSKFTSCSDDRTVRIFDFTTCTEESVLQGHGSDVKCVDWHPFKALIISGSKDSQQPIILWDARNAKKITTLHAHKNTCTDLKWNQFNGNWLISSSRDHLCKLFDIRNLKEEVQSFRGHKKDACTLAWHPIHEKVFASGGADGSLFFWLVNAEKELGNMEEAHEGMVWDMSWHPLGHMLVSGSNDRSTRFWTRNRPGDAVLERMDDSFAPKIERATGIIFKNIELPEPDNDQEGLITLPGLGLENMTDLLNDDEESPNTSANLISPVKPAQSQAHEHHHQHHHQQQSHGSMSIQQQHQYHNQHFQSYQQQNSNQIPQQQQQMRKMTQANEFDADDDENRRKKAPYAKPIPKEFEKAWKSNKPISQTQQQPSQNTQIGNIMSLASSSLQANIMNQTSGNINSSATNNSNSISSKSMQQQPPSLMSSNNPTTNIANNSAKSGSAGPIRLMDLMSAKIEPPPLIQTSTNFSSGPNKRKLSQDNPNSLNNSDSIDQDERQGWTQPKSKQFFQKNNYNNNSNDGDDNYDEANHNNGGYRRNINNSNNNKRNFGNNNSKFNNQNQNDDENNIGNNNQQDDNQNYFNKNYDDGNRNRGGGMNRNVRGGRGGGGVGGGSSGSGGFVKRFNNSNNNQGADEDNSNDNYDNENSNNNFNNNRMNYQQRRVGGNSNNNNSGFQNRRGGGFQNNNNSN